ncbi:hypothetical protein, partial [Streptomyces gibsoniae]
MRLQQISTGVGSKDDDFDVGAATMLSFNSEACGKGVSPVIEMLLGEQLTGSTVIHHENVNHVASLPKV